MNVTVETEVNLPDEEVFRTILEDWYADERLTPDGWCQFSSFEEFIRCKYQMALNHSKERAKGLR